MLCTEFWPVIKFKALEMKYDWSVYSLILTGYDCLNWRFLPNFVLCTNMFSTICHFVWDHYLICVFVFAIFWHNHFAFKKHFLVFLYLQLTHYYFKAHTVCLTRHDNIALQVYIEERGKLGSKGQSFISSTYLVKQCVCFFKV